MMQIRCALLVLPKAKGEPSYRGHKEEQDMSPLYVKTRGIRLAASVAKQMNRRGVSIISSNALLTANALYDDDDDGKGDIP